MSKFCLKHPMKLCSQDLQSFFSGFILTPPCLQSCCENKWETTHSSEILIWESGGGSWMLMSLSFLKFQPWPLSHLGYFSNLEFSLPASLTTHSPDPWGNSESLPVLATCGWSSSSITASNWGIEMRRTGRQTEGRGVPLPPYQSELPSTASSGFLRR